MWSVHFILKGILCCSLVPLKLLFMGWRQDLAWLGLSQGLVSCRGGSRSQGTARGRRVCSTDWGTQAVFFWALQFVLETSVKYVWLFLSPTSARFGAFMLFPYFSLSWTGLYAQYFGTHRGPSLWCLFVHFSQNAFPPAFVLVCGLL